MTLAPVLLVEDNLDDVELTRLAFAEARHRASAGGRADGAEALDYLFARGIHAGRDPDALPALMLLDLNLPKLDGREVMQAIRADPTTRHLPVVALTTSAEPIDIEASYALGVNSYIQKPVDFARFVEEVERLRAQWLD